MVKVEKGLVFTHPHMLDPFWKPQEGQTYAKDAPRATCVVTAVRGKAVYFTYHPIPAGTRVKGRWVSSAQILFPDHAQEE